MTLEVHTARFDYDGPDRMDITCSTGHSVFAPSWDLLRSAHPKYAKAQGRGNLLSWEEYVEAYTREMRRSYRDNVVSWSRLLSKERVVLVCYCKNHERCHRTILARILVKLGAVYAGELDNQMKLPV